MRGGGTGRCLARRVQERVLGPGNPQWGLESCRLSVSTWVCPSQVPPWIGELSGG